MMQKTCAIFVTTALLMSSMVTLPAAWASEPPASPTPSPTILAEYTFSELSPLYKALVVNQYRKKQSISVTSDAIKSKDDIDRKILYDIYTISDSEMAIIDKHYAFIQDYPNKNPDLKKLAGIQEKKSEYIDEILYMNESKIKNDNKIEDVKKALFIGHFKDQIIKHESDKSSSKINNETYSCDISNQNKWLQNFSEQCHEILNATPLDKFKERLEKDKKAVSWLLLLTEPSEEIEKEIEKEINKLKETKLDLFFIITGLRDQDISLEKIYDKYKSVKINGDNQNFKAFKKAYNQRPNEHRELNYKQIKSVTNQVLSPPAPPSTPKPSASPEPQKEPSKQADSFEKFALHFIGGTTDFMIERGKSEITLAFFKRLTNQKEFKDKLENIFPSTNTVIENMNHYSYSLFIQNIKEAYQKDLDQFYENIFDYILKKDGLSNSEKILSDSKKFFDAYQKSSSFHSFITHLSFANFNSDANNLKETSHFFSWFLNLLKNPEGDILYQDLEKLLNDEYTRALFIAYIKDEMKEKSELKDEEIIELVLSIQQYFFLFSEIHKEYQNNTDPEQIFKLKQKEFQTTLALIKDIFKIKNSDIPLKHINEVAHIHFAIQQKNYSLALTEAIKLTKSLKPDLQLEKNFVEVITFFNRLLEAKNDQDIQKAIEAIALPAGNSSIKKQGSDGFGVWDLELGSYLGLLLGGHQHLNTFQKSENKNPLGIFAPIGFNFNFFRGQDMSLSAFFPMLDLSSSVVMKLNADKTSVSPDFDAYNLMSPGGFLVINLSQVPMSFGFGAQFRPFTSQDQHNWDYRVGMFLGIDIPFFTLYHNDGRTHKDDSPTTP